MLNAVWCALVKFINSLSENILQKIIDSIAWVVNLLPSMPFEFNPIPWGDFGRSLGYFIPISTMVQHFVMMLALMLLWYSIEYAMRWIKMIK